jgi:FixJ family two-component response regulator
VPDKILLVDDEADLLRGYQIMLRQDFAIDTAVGGEQALAAIRQKGPYAVVVSDMQMPGMNGVEFLARVRQVDAYAIRVMLTGQTDIGIAKDAVNEGNIFRFLTKPCDRSVLVTALQAAIAQHQLAIAEQELLGNTLMGSIKVLTDVLAAVSPLAFGRSMRLTRCVRHLAEKFHLPQTWCFEAAAMLSQLGCMTLPPEIMQAAAAGEKLLAAEQARFDAHPQMTADLLVSIPRMEPVAWMIRHHLSEILPPSAPNTPAFPRELAVFGAKLLRTAVAFDNAILRGLSAEDAIMHLRRKPAEFDAEIVDRLSDFKAAEPKSELRKLQISALDIGMVLQQDVRNQAGLLIVAKGQEITSPLLARLETFSRSQLVDSEILALVPVLAMER